MFCNLKWLSSVLIILFYTSKTDECVNYGLQKWNIDRYNYSFPSANYSLQPINLVNRLIQLHFVTSIILEAIRNFCQIYDQKIKTFFLNTPLMYPHSKCLSYTFAARKSHLNDSFHLRLLCQCTSQIIIY